MKQDHFIIHKNVNEYIPLAPVPQVPPLYGGILENYILPPYQPNQPSQEFLLRVYIASIGAIGMIILFPFFSQIL